MSATAPVEVAATLVAPPAAPGRSPASATPQSGVAFTKVLDEQTAKALDTAAHDRRDTPAKSTRRSRTSSDSAPLATERVAAGASSVRPSDVTLPPMVDVAAKNVNGTSSTPQTPTDELLASWHPAVPAVDDSDVGSPTPTELAVPTSVTDEMSVGSFAPSLLTEGEELASTPTSTSVLATTKDENVGLEAKVTAASAASVEAAPARGTALSATAASAVTPTSSATSTLDVASALARRLLPALVTPTTSHGAVTRVGSNTSGSVDTAPTLTRRATGVSGATTKPGEELVVPTNSGLSARASVGSASSVAVSSAEEAPSLDVPELANSISQAVLGPGGSYTINVAMHPADLGHVQAVVTLSGNDLHVAIAPQTPAGHAALASAADALKSELSRSGLNVNVSLRDPDSRSGRGNEELPRPALTDSDMPPGAGESTAVSESLTVSQIHLIL
jgi:hypothetical protein